MVLSYSETLIATAADSRNDVLSTSAVLIAAVLCRVTGWDVLDGLMGVGVAAFILTSSIFLFCSVDHNKKGHSSKISFRKMSL